MTDDVRQRYAEALAAKFTEPRYRCDRDGENERVENPEPADRVEQTPRIVFTAGDGHLSSRTPTCMELGEVVAAVRDEDLDQLRIDRRRYAGMYVEERARAEKAEIALREALGRVDSGEYWKAREAIKAALDGTEEDGRG